MQTINFKSIDGLMITADYYQVQNPRDVILLCHRSHFNRGEYKEIAPKLNELGYSCLAIDQRSGMNVLGYTNETYNLAKKSKLPTGYNDAKQDIKAAINYLYVENDNKPIILLGSSYSASLALILGVNNSKVKAVIAYSPGEYLKKISVKDSIKDISIPVYLSSSKEEIDQTSELAQGIDKKLITHFKSMTEGAHGARVLWSKIKNNEEYWVSLKSFLASI